MEVIKIDGSAGEGGGSVLRLSIGFSVLSHTPIEIVNIRAKRPQPGLKTQHLVGVRAIKELCGATVKGDELGSTRLYFEPGDEWKDKLNLRISTAGSIGLVLQQLQLACHVAPLPKITVNVEGGATFGKWAPTTPYLEQITLHWLRTFFKYDITLTVHRHGFYPRGGAKVTIVLKPPSLDKARNISHDLSDPGQIEKIGIISLETQHLSRARVAKRQAESALQELQPFLSKRGLEEPEIKYMTVSASNPGSGVLIWAKTDRGVTLGVDNLGERGKKAEIVGKEAAQRFSWECLTGQPHPPSTDSHLLDQILPFMAMTKNFAVTTRKITSHSQTNLQLIKKFLNIDLNVKKKNDFLVLIEK